MNNCTTNFWGCALVACALALVSVSTPAEVQRLNSGSILQQKKSESRGLNQGSGSAGSQSVLKELPLPLKQPHYALNCYEFIGNMKVTSEELAAVVRPYVGHEITDPQLDQLTEAINSIYKSHGYGFTWVTVDFIALRQGCARFSIVEGKAGKVVLDNRARVNDWLVGGPLERFRGRPDNTDSLERANLLMGDIPGVSSVTPRLSRGVIDGTVDVTMEAKKSPLVGGYVSIDNYGSYSSGRTRMSAMIGINSPFGWGDSLRMNAVGMPFHVDGNSTLGGGVYDFPLGNDGVRGGIGYNRLRYNLGGIYAGLFDGTADVWSGYASYPIIRQQSGSLYGQLTYSHSLYRDNQMAYENSRRADALTLGVHGDHQDSQFGRNGINRYALTLTHGKLSYDSAFFEQQDRQGSKTAGDYTKVELSVSRTQQLSYSTYLQVELQGQQAFKNLDGASRLVLGGPSGIRAFSSDFISVDSGGLLRGTAGWHLPISLPTTLYTFYDAAAGALRHTPERGVPNSINLQGVGVGVDASYYNVSASISVATRVGGDALGIQNQPRSWVWASLGYNY